jgi:anthranilate phosphoribosyltransferase
MTAVLRILKCEHALVVHGEGGFDEFSTLGVSIVSELRDGSIRNFSMHVSETGLSTGKRQEVNGGDPKANAEIIRSILDGVSGGASDLALLNAGAAVYVGGRADSVGEGIKVARETLLSGSAKKKLHDWIEASNSV